MRFPAAALAALTALAPVASAQTATAVADPGLVGRYQATITPAELAGHLYVYADDYLAGRETGEPGQRFAARYLAGQYATLGIAARGTGPDNGNYGIDGYLQPFALEQSTLVSLTGLVEQAGTPVLTSTLAEGDTETAFLIPAYGQVEDDTPGRLVFVEEAVAQRDEHRLVRLPHELLYDGRELGGADVLAVRRLLGRNDASAICEQMGEDVAVGGSRVFRLDVVELPQMPDVRVVSEEGGPSHRAFFRRSSRGLSLPPLSGSVTPFRG